MIDRPRSDWGDDEATDDSVVRPLVAACQAAARAEHALRGQLRRRPYVTLGAAGGVGYVLGGGLPPGLIRLALRSATRALMTAVIRELVLERGVIASDPDPAGAASDARSTFPDPQELTT